MFNSNTRDCLVKAGNNIFRDLSYGRKLFIPGLEVSGLFAPAECLLLGEGPNHGAAIPCFSMTGRIMPGEQAPFGEDEVIAFCRLVQGFDLPPEHSIPLSWRPLRQHLGCAGTVLVLVIFRGKRPFHQYPILPYPDPGYNGVLLKHAAAALQENVRIASGIDRPGKAMAGALSLA